MNEKISMKFWGVRGSFPTPHADKMIYGGNTSCISLQLSENDLILFDMGTGALDLGKNLITNKNSPKNINVLLSHYHWDHIFGFLGFAPFFNDAYHVNVYGKSDTKSAKDILNHIMDNTFWPVDLSMMAAKIDFHAFPDNKLVINDDTIVRCTLHGHPNGANTYRVEYKNKIIVYSTDCEHPEHSLNPNIISIAKDADIFIHDAHFTNEELPAHKGWGHASWEQCIEIAKKANVKKLILYHHDPYKNDDMIAAIEKEAQKKFKKTISAREGMEIIL